MHKPSFLAVRWRCFDRNDLLVLNVDRASKGNPGPAAIGGIIRHSDGRFIAGLHGFIGQKSNNEAEIQAMYRGVQLCLSLDLKQVLVQSDSMFLIQLLAGKFPAPWSFYYGVRSILHLVAAHSFTFVHIYREKNKTSFTQIQII